MERELVNARGKKNEDVTEISDDEDQKVNILILRDRLIICTDLQTRTMFGFRLKFVLKYFIIVIAKGRLGGLAVPCQVSFWHDSYNNVGLVYGATQTYSFSNDVKSAVSETDDLASVVPPAMWRLRD